MTSLVFTQEADRFSFHLIYLSASRPHSPDVIYAPQALSQVLGCIQKALFYDSGERRCVRQR